MRPLQLTMSAFCSYSSSTTIDFSRFGDHGLFLVAGETGSGKTTIFDAIVYALFGECSRQTKSLRSVSAEPLTRTFVEFSFCYAGENYKVKRNPEYMRPLLRGDGWTNETASVSLTLPDGSEISQERKVSAKIAEIFGINGAQFSQIMMLQQGQFRKLLDADTKARREIFRGLFRTEKYESLQKKIAEQRSEQKSISGNEKNKLDQACKKVGLAENSQYKEAWMPYCKECINASEAIEVLNGIVSEDKDLRDQINSTIVQLDAALQKLAVQINSAESAQAMRTQQLGLTHQLETQKNRNQELLQKVETLRQQIPEIEKLNEEITLRKEQLAKYDLYDQKCTDLKQHETSYQKDSESCARLDAELKSSGEQLEANKQELTSLGDVESQIVALKNKLAAENDKITKLEKIGVDYSDIKKIELTIGELKNSLANFKSRLDKEKENAQNLSDEYDKLKGCELKKSHAVEQQKELKRELEALQLIIRQQNNIDKVNKEIAKLEQNCISLENSKIEAETKRDELNAEREAKSGAEACMASVSAKLDLCDKRKKELEDLEGMLETVNKKQLEYQNAQNDYSDKRTAYNKANDKFNLIDQLIRDDKAGFLAQNLEDGKPCPVCGSVHHPSPAQRAEKVPDEKELKKADKLRNEAQKALDISSNNAASAKGEYNAANDLLNQKLCAALQVECCSEPKAALDEAQKALKSERDDWQKQFDDAKAQKARCEELKKCIDAVEKSLSKLNEQVSNCKNSVSAKQAERDTMSRQLNDDVQKLNIEAENGGLDAIVSNRCEEIKMALCAVDNSITELGKQVDRAAELSQKLIPQVNKTVEKIQSDVNDYTNRLSSEQSKKDTAAEHLLREAQALLGSDVSMDSLEGMLKENVLAVKDTIQSISKELNKENERAQRKKTLENAIPALEKQIEQQSKKINTMRESLAGLGAKIDSSRKEIEDLRKGLDCDNREKAEQKIKELSQKINNMQTSIKNAETDYANNTTTCSNLEAQIKQLAEQLADAPVVEVDSLKVQQANLEAQKNNKKQDYDSVVSRHTTNSDSLKTLKTASSAIDKMKQRSDALASLDNLFAGKLSGNKVNLETWVQTAYFDRVLSFANSRFHAMTNRQYLLKRREEPKGGNSQSGLELNVIDIFANETERLANTLSGGESFLASLALALGMSDEIQQSSGGIQLDSLFVDEGFGTLDPETLNRAMKALLDLQGGNRLVGIISHVEGLDKKIGNQLKIEKDSVKGSVVRTIVESE